MATKTDLADVARRAKEAKLNGSVGDFVQAEQIKKASQVAAAKTAASPFASLSRSRPASETTEASTLKAMTSATPAPANTIEPEQPGMTQDDHPSQPDIADHDLQDDIDSDDDALYDFEPDEPVAQPPVVNEPPAQLVQASTPISAPAASPRPAPPTTGNLLPPTRSATPDLASRIATMTNLSRQRRNALAEANLDKDGKPAVLRQPAKRIGDDPPWACDQIPAGSHYTLQEWNQARALGNNTVIEVRNAGQGALITIPKCPEGVTTKVRKNGVLTEEYVAPAAKDLAGKLNPLFSHVWDGCLILAPSAQTSHPASISGVLQFNTNDKDFGNMPYRIVRPEAHRHIESLAVFYGLKGHFEAGALGLAGATYEAVQIAEATDQIQEAFDEPVQEPVRERG